MRLGFLERQRPRGHADLPADRLGEQPERHAFGDGVERLAPCGTLLLYTGVAMVGNQDPFLREVSQRLEGRDLQWTYREVDPDVFGEELLDGAYTECDRIAAVVLEVTRPAENRRDA